MPRNSENTVQFFRREFDVDVVREYERLKEFAAIPVEKLTDAYYLSEQINQASRNAHVAFLMYLKMRRKVANFELEFEKKMRELTRLALARLKTWLETADIGKKQITKDMIHEEIVAGPDTADIYYEYYEKLEDLKSIRDAMENFSQMWQDRKFSLQTQAGLAKSKKDVNLGG